MVVEYWESVREKWGFLFSEHLRFVSPQPEEADQEAEEEKEEEIAACSICFPSPIDYLVRTIVRLLLDVCFHFHAWIDCVRLLNSHCIAISMMTKMMMLLFSREHREKWNHQIVLVFFLLDFDRFHVLTCGACSFDDIYHVMPSVGRFELWKIDCGVAGAEGGSLQRVTVSIFPYIPSASVATRC